LAQRVRKDFSRNSIRNVKFIGAVTHAWQHWENKGAPGENFRGLDQLQRENSRGLDELQGEDWTSSWERILEDWTSSRERILED
jgi:hypothetical protein